MKLKLVLLCLIFSSLAFAQAQPATINDFAWLAGCWERSGNGWEGVEQWMKPAGATMLGMSRTVANGKLREFEFLQLRTKEDGTIHYVALPSGQQETWFKLVKSAEHEAVFENLEHDFPQRIGYRTDGANRLLAWVEGTMNGTARRIDFTYQRVACP